MEDLSDFYTEPAIPAGCSQCPQVLLRLEALRDLHEKADVTADIAFGDMPEAVAAEALQYAQENGLGSTPSAATLRAHGAEALESIDDECTTIENFLAHLTTGCAGRICLRARRGGITYSSGICTSPLAPIGQGVEPTTITRTPDAQAK